MAAVPSHKGLGAATAGIMNGKGRQKLAPSRTDFTGGSVAVSVATLIMNVLLNQAFVWNYAFVTSQKTIGPFAL